MPRTIPGAIGMQKNIGPSIFDTVTGTEDMVRVVPRDNRIPLVAKIARERVIGAFFRMHGAIGLEFPAPPAVRIEGTTEELDEVRNEERRNVFRKVGEMQDDGVSIRDIKLPASLTKMTEVVFPEAEAVS